jgi:hypothetical protein
MAYGGLAVSRCLAKLPELYDWLHAFVVFAESGVSPLHPAYRLRYCRLQQRLRRTARLAPTPLPILQRANRYAQHGREICLRQTALDPRFGGLAYMRGESATATSVYLANRFQYLGTNIASGITFKNFLAQLYS